MAKLNFNADLRSVEQEGYTYFREVNMWVCNNCGSSSEALETIEHYKTCKPGESKRWENFYKRANKEEDIRQTLFHKDPEDLEHEDLMMNELSKIDSPDFKPIEFILAGNAHFTIRSKKTSKRFTYHVLKRRKSNTGQPIYFVKVLTGPDNNQSYTYLGTIFSDTLKYVHGRKSSISFTAPSNQAFGWFWASTMKVGNIPSTVEVFHEGRCGRCGRRLTVPESIRSGFGPECINKV